MTEKDLEKLLDGISNIEGAVLTIEETLEKRLKRLCEAAEDVQSTIPFEEQIALEVMLAMIEGGNLNRSTESVRKMIIDNSFLWAKDFLAAVDEHKKEKQDDEKKR